MNTNKTNTNQSSFAFNSEIIEQKINMNLKNKDLENLRPDKIGPLGKPLQSEMESSLVNNKENLNGNNSIIKQLYKEPEFQYPSSLSNANNHDVINYKHEKYRSRSKKNNTNTKHFTSFTSPKLSNEPSIPSLIKNSIISNSKHLKSKQKKLKKKIKKQIVSSQISNKKLLERESYFSK